MVSNEEIELLTDGGKHEHELYSCCESPKGRRGE